MRDLISTFLKGPQTFETPDLTKAQQVAIGQAVVALVAVFGFDVAGDDRELVVGLAGAIAAILPLSDAALRRGRAQYAPQIAAARREAERPRPTSDERRRLLELQERLERLR